MEASHDLLLCNARGGDFRAGRGGFLGRQIRKTPNRTKSLTTTYESIAPLTRHSRREFLRDSGAPFKLRQTRTNANAAQRWRQVRRPAHPCSHVADMCSTAAT